MHCALCVIARLLMQAKRNKIVNYYNYMLM